MPTNKNALTRYKYLDELLSDRHHYYDIHDLSEKCNQRLVEDGFPEVTQRCIEKDINYIEYAPFSADIERFRVNGKRCLRYENPSFSIFRKELTEEECNLLCEVLNTIGQFDGLDNFEWMNSMKIGLGLKERPKVISFSNNPYLKNSNMLGMLFDYISNQVVVQLSYHTFSDATTKSIVFHPYLLKQYNNRWYLIGAADIDGKILNFAIDRLDEVKALPKHIYKKYTQDLAERFDDIVGVSLYEDRPVEHILCWVSDVSKGYVDTKPIHGSYTPIKGDVEQQLRSEFSRLQGGMFFTLDCIKNYELIRELCSYGKDLIVLRSDGTVADDVKKRVSEMMEQYSRIENNK